MQAMELDRAIDSVMDGTLGSISRAAQAKSSADQRALERANA